MKSAMRYALLLFACLAWLMPGTALALEVDVKVSSQKVDFGLEYGPEALLDGDPSTAWAVGKASAGPGEWMEFSFALPVRVVQLGIYNGHQGEGMFEKFRRIRSGRILYPDGTETRFWLRDEPGEQIISCPIKPVKSIKIVVDEVFPRGVPLARMKLAVSEVKFYLTLMNRQTSGAAIDAHNASIPGLPPADLGGKVPEEIKDLLRTFYVRQTSLDDDYYLLFAPHVRDKFDFQFEYFKEIFRQRGTFRKLRSAKVDPSGLRFDLVYLNKDLAEVRVFGSYHVQVADLDKDLEDDSVFVLMKGVDGWRILELDDQE
ncbi:MAG: discoidin domain-containing protein [Desulfovibrionaceae bacterium]|nr:discoidin domain-containing protein [Desulfovibrionaceae bacterium]